MGFRSTLSLADPPGSFCRISWKESCRSHLKNVQNVLSNVQKMSKKTHGNILEWTPGTVSEASVGSYALRTSGGIFGVTPGYT